MSKFSYNGRGFSYWVLPLFFFSLNQTTAKPRDCPARITEQARLPDPAWKQTPADKAPKLDGTLDDPLWQLASLITDFRQREPDEGQPSTEKNEVRILYTRHVVYFGIHYYDSAASQIVATELRRDVTQELDDHFEILIDSNRNRRGAYPTRSSPKEGNHLGSDAAG